MAMPSDFANLDSGSDDNLVAQYYSKPLNDLLTRYMSFYNKRDLRGASDAYNQALESIYPQSAANANANFYSDYTKQIIGDPNTYIGDYETIRGGNLAALGDVYKNVLDYGLAGQKARLAAGGYGNTGPSSYDRILSSTMAASNLNPVLNTIFNNLGREATASYGSRVDQNRYLLDLFAQDPLGDYAYNAASRALNPYLTRMGLVGGNIGALGGLGGNIKNNLAGYQLVRGLTSRMQQNEAAQGNDMTGGLYGQRAYAGDSSSTSKWLLSMIGSYGTSGAMGGMGGGGAGGQSNPTPYQSGGNSAGAPSWQQAPAYGGYGMSYDQPSAQEQYYRNLLNSSGGNTLGTY